MGEEGGLQKVFKNTTDRLSIGTMEWNNYQVAIRECIVFHLEDNVKYRDIFGTLWTETIVRDDEYQSAIYSPMKLKSMLSYDPSTMQSTKPSTLREMASDTLNAVDYEKVVLCALRRE